MMKLPTIDCTNRGQLPYRVMSSKVADREGQAHRDAHQGNAENYGHDNYPEGAFSVLTSDPDHPRDLSYRRAELVHVLLLHLVCSHSNSRACSHVHTAVGLPDWCR